MGHGRCSLFLFVFFFGFGLEGENDVFFGGESFPFFERHEVVDFKAVHDRAREIFVDEEFIFGGNAVAEHVVADDFLRGFGVGFALADDLANFVVAGGEGINEGRAIFDADPGVLHDDAAAEFFAGLDGGAGGFDFGDQVRGLLMA